MKIKTVDDVEIVKTAIEYRLNKMEEVVHVLATNSLLDSIDDIFNSISLFLMEALFLRIAASLVGGMYPAWKAANVGVLDALRYG